MHVYEPKGDNICFLGFKPLNFLQSSFQLKDYHIEPYHKKYLQISCGVAKRKKICLFKSIINVQFHDHIPKSSTLVLQSISSTQMLWFINSPSMMQTLSFIIPIFCEALPWYIVCYKSPSYHYLQTCNIQPTKTKINNDQSSQML